MNQCPSCGGDCGYTKSKGCQYGMLPDDCVLSNDDFHEGDFIVVYKVTLPGGDFCYVGTQSLAKAQARSKGKWEEVRIPRRDFKLTDMEEKNKYQVRWAILSDKLNGTPCEQIRHQQEVEALKSERDQIAAKERESVKKMIMNGSFLHDDAPTKRFAIEVCKAIDAMKGERG